MTFTTRIKEEITSIEPNILDARIELLAYLKFASIKENNKINIYIENPNVARYINKN